jgi:DNA-binding transcriptional LysR family regulator
MPKLPDLEGLAIFAKVTETHSFARAATELSLSKVTVSKAVSRVEARLGARLINRTSRRFALTDAGRQLAVRAANILADGEAAEDAAVAQATVPRGLIRLAVPMSFGQLHVAPLLPEFLAMFPEVLIDLHLSDAKVDLIGEGFDAAIRIAVLTSSTLVARRLCEMPRYVVGSPSYLNTHGRPKHPIHLARHWLSLPSQGQKGLFECRHSLRGGIGDMMSQCSTIQPFCTRKRSQFAVGPCGILASTSARTKFPSATYRTGFNVGSAPGFSTPATRFFIRSVPSPTAAACCV